MFYVYCSSNGSLTRPTLSIIISSIISWRLINVLISFHAASRSIHVTQWVERYVAFHYGVYELPWCHLWYFEKKHYFFSHSDESMFHRFYIVIKYLVQRWRKLTGCDWASPPTVNLTSRWCVLDQHFRRHFIGHEDVCSAVTLWQISGWRCPSMNVYKCVLLIHSIEIMDIMHHTYNIDSYYFNSMPMYNPDLISSKNKTEFCL